MLAKKTPIVVPPPPRKHGVRVQVPDRQPPPRKHGVQVPARQPPPRKRGVHVRDGHRMMISDIGYGPRSPYLPHVLPPCKYPKPSSKPEAKPTATPTDCKDSDCRWNSWISKERWIQDERVEYKDHPIGQWSNSLQKWEDEKWEDEKTEKLTWNSWNSMDKWIQDERVEYKDHPIGQWSNSLQKWEDEKWEDEKTENSWNSKEKWIQDERVEHKDYPIGQWSNWRQKWEDEKTEKLTEPCCHEVDDDEYELIREEEDHVEELIKTTREVLQRHRGEAPVHRSGKRGRSPLPHELSYPPSKKSRMGRGGKAASKRAKKARSAKLDGKRELTEVEVGELRYSQLSCKETFTCGRSIPQLVQGLLNGKVSLSAAFLRLTVFETRDEKTNEPILRCIDNRRLFALKEYAKKSGKDRVMVNVNFFNNNTLTEVQRFIHNSDDTNGRGVRLRRNRQDKHRQR